MTNNLYLEIITPDGAIFSGEVQDVLLPGEEGEFGILPEHVSLFTLLQAGVIDFTTIDGKKDSVVINSGNVTLSNNKVIALIDGAVQLNKNGDISKELEKIKELLKNVSNSNTVIASVEARLN
jgi:F-type H+-transporting ATPase subunit epsilon